MTSNDHPILVSAEEGLQRLMDGNARFLNGTARFPTVRKDVLAAMDTDAHTISILLPARDRNRNLLIVARASHTETEVKLELARATRLVSPDTIAGQCMAGDALEQGGVACSSFSKISLLSRVAKLLYS